MHDAFSVLSRFSAHFWFRVASRNVGVSGLVVECRIRDFQVAGSNITAGHLQATLSKLLTYGVLKSTQPPTLRGTRNE